MKMLYVSGRNRSKELNLFFNVFRANGISIEFHNEVADPDAFLKIYHRYEPNILLVHHNKRWFSPEIYHQLQDSFNLYWRNDERYPIEDWFLGMIPYFNLFMLSSEDCAESIRKIGGNAVRLMMGFNPYKISNKDRYMDVVFTGHNHEVLPLSKKREDIICRLRDNRKEFHLFGKGWGDDCVVTRSIVYEVSKIGISIGHFATRRTYSNRMYQIMGNRALCLCYNEPGMELNKVFRGLDFFSTYDELNKKIDKYLSDNILREKIAMEGYSYVMANYRWDIVAVRIIKHLRKMIPWT